MIFKKVIDEEVFITELSLDEFEELKKIENSLNNNQSFSIEERIENLENTNQIQDELINISLMATDEMYMMIEPLLEVSQVNERGLSRMVDMYVAMVQRGLKTIESVPLRYREEVKRILEALEK